MMNAARLLLAFVISFSVSSCKTTPPPITQCIYNAPRVGADCAPPAGDVEFRAGPELDKYVMIPPDDYHALLEYIKRLKDGQP